MRQESYTSSIIPVLCGYNNSIIVASASSVITDGITIENNIRKGYITPFIDFLSPIQ